MRIRRKRQYKKKKRSKILTLRRFKRRKLKRLSFKRKRKLQEKLARIEKKKKIKEKEEEEPKIKKLIPTRVQLKIIKRYKKYKRTKVRRKTVYKIKKKRRKARRKWKKIKLQIRRRRLLRIRKKRLPAMIKFMLRRIVYRHPIKLTFDQKLAKCNPMRFSDRQFSRGYFSKRAKRHLARLEALRKLEKKYEKKYIAPFRYLRKQCKIVGYRKNIHERLRYEYIPDIKSYIFTVNLDNLMRGIHRDVPCHWARIRRRPRMNGMINYDFLPFLD